MVEPFQVDNIHVWSNVGAIQPLLRMGSRSRARVHEMQITHEWNQRAVFVADT